VNYLSVMHGTHRTVPYSVHLKLLSLYQLSYFKEILHKSSVFLVI
jgi:hypothetical protein